MIAFIPTSGDKPAFFTSGNSARADQLNTQLRDAQLEHLGLWTALSKNERKLLSAVEQALVP